MSLVPVTGSVSFCSAETPVPCLKCAVRGQSGVGTDAELMRVTSLGEEGKGEHRIHTILVTRKLEFIIAPNERQAGSYGR